MCAKAVQVSGPAGLLRGLLCRRGTRLLTCSDRIVTLCPREQTPEATRAHWVLSLTDTSDGEVVDRSMAVQNEVWRLELTGPLCWALRPG
jgi:hypothetical protein